MRKKHSQLNTGLDFMRLVRHQIDASRAEVISQAILMILTIEVSPKHLLILFSHHSLRISQGLSPFLNYGQNNMDPPHSTS